MCPFVALASKVNRFKNIVEYLGVLNFFLSAQMSTNVNLGAKIKETNEIIQRVNHCH